MHARRLAELAAWIAVEASTPVAGSKEFTAASAQAYWTASKCRLERWNIALKVFSQDLSNEAAHHNPWPAIRVVTEEILMSEVLTRVWSAVLTDYDRSQGTQELCGIAHSVFIGHMETRNRALRLLLQCADSEIDVARQLDQVRRHLERWTDLLLSHIANQKNASRFAHETARVAEFSRDRRLVSSKGRRRTSQWLVASLANDLATITSSLPANPDLNAQTAAGVLAFFPADRFDSQGHFKSTSMLWIESAQRDTEVLVSEFLYEYHTPPTGPIAANRLSTIEGNG